jgi:hypothetical protein
MTSTEYQELILRHQRQLEEVAQDELQKAAGFIDRFTRLAASRGIGLESQAFNYSLALGVTASAPGLALALVDILPSPRDKLLAWEDLAKRFALDQIDSGTFSGMDFMVLAHPCFRRGMHPQANWAPRFIELFWALESPELDKFIAIDEDRVRIDVDGPLYMEADTWYGPPFDEDIRNIRNGNVKLRPPGDLSSTHLDFFFASAYSLDVCWTERDGIKTFQALELKTETTVVQLDGVPHHPARYLHAEFDLSTGNFRHFDGAVQYLREDEYLLRRDTDFSMIYKDTRQVKPRSKKVFKLNGLLPTETWVELCGHFMAANPLMHEYFIGEYPESISRVLAVIRANRQGEGT